MKTTDNKLTKNQRYLIVSLGAEFMSYYVGEDDCNDSFPTQTIEAFLECKEYIDEVLETFKVTGESMTPKMQEFLDKYLAIKWPIVPVELSDRAHVRDLDQFKPLEPLFYELT